MITIDPLDDELDRDEKPDRLKRAQSPPGRGKDAPGAVEVKRAGLWTALFRRLFLVRKAEEEGER